MSDRYGYIAIETLLNFCENSKDHAVTPNDFMRMARVRVPEPEQRWIPCSEMLPEAPGFVNCTCHSLIDNREDWVVETFYMPHPSGSPYSDWGNIPMLNDGKCEVVAWMYRNIPEPHKAESEDKE